jgi:hypothetical protein
VRVEERECFCVCGDGGGRASETGVDREDCNKLARVFGAFEMLSYYYNQRLHLQQF